MGVVAHAQYLSQSLPIGPAHLRFLPVVVDHVVAAWPVPEAEGGAIRPGGDGNGLGQDAVPVGLATAVCPQQGGIAAAVHRIGGDDGQLHTAGRPGGKSAAFKPAVGHQSWRRRW